MEKRCPIFGKGLAPVKQSQFMGIHTADVASGIQHPDVQYIGRKEEAVDYLFDRIRPGDVVLTLGAGDSNQVGERLLEKLRTRVEAYRP